jgi:hypothetical protein
VLPTWLIFSLYKMPVKKKKERNTSIDIYNVSDIPGMYKQRIKKLKRPSIVREGGGNKEHTASTYLTDKFSKTKARASPCSSDWPYNHDPPVSAPSAEIIGRNYHT